MFDHLQESNSARARYWVFTLNNYSEDDMFYLINLPNDDSNCISYIAFSEEVAPTTQTRHLQGHLECSKAIRFAQLKPLVSPRAFLAVRRGSFEASEEYISKESSPFQSGERVSRGPGARTDLEAAVSCLRDSGSLFQLSEEHTATFLRYHRGFQKWIELHQKKREWVTEVYIYWGKTGTGKTRKVFDESSDLYVHTEEKWFDGYTGQESVLFDDFHGGVFKLPYLLKLLDRYPMQVPVKGGFISWVPKKIYITSNIDPREWFPNANSEHVAALFRRVTNIIHFDTFP